MSSLMLDHALAYARKGWRVFPLHSIRPDGKCTCSRSNNICDARPAAPGKHPRIKGGFKSASTDRAEITKWWTRWPSANIGVATGSGLCVIDPDGEEGYSKFKALVAKNGVLPDTLVSKTGNGYHFVFAYDANGPEIRSTRPTDKIDVKAEGGYIVAPPSIHHTGRRYTWVRDKTLGSLPEWTRQWSQGYEVTANRVSVLSAQPAHLAKYKQRDTGRRLSEALVTVWSPSEQARLESALQAIPSDSYETWFTVGMALQQLRWETNEGDAGFDLWDRWSQGTPSKYAPEICEEKWRTFGRGDRAGVTVGSIYHLANQHGWNPAAEATAPKKMNGHHVELPAELTAKPIIWPDLGKPDEETGARRPRVTMKNAMAALMHMGIDCRYNRFNYRYMLHGHAIQQYGFDHLVDPVVVVLRNSARDTYGIDFNKTNVGDALETIGLQNHFDPVVGYLDDVQPRWDGVPRLDTWLSRYLAAEDSELIRQFGRLTLIAAVRRARQPGTKFDQILVLEGGEGTGKSQAVRILAGDAHFSDATLLHLDAKAQQENTEGVWIYELSELNGIKRTDAESLKQFASRPDDRARPAYGRYLQTRPRRCIFIGTTNRNDYLVSDTGNRRFWPVKTGRVDLDGLARDRDQLWAEAAALETRGVSIVLPEKFWSLASEEQDKRMESDMWFEAIQEYLMVEGRLRDSASTHEVLCSNPRFQLQFGQIKRMEEMRAGSILRRLGYTDRRKCRTDKGFEYRYFRRELPAP